jgi:hypothetical protein
MSKISASELTEKECKICERTFPIEHFYKQKAYNKKDKTIMYNTWDCYCIPCRLKYSADRQRTIKRQAIEYLGGKCVDCGECRDIPSIYDFHHIDPSRKDFSISHTTLKFETIKKELDKCVILCATCHRIKHCE